jgi:transmembrane sensor
MKPNPRILEKYFDGTASREEVAAILEWFKSREGQIFLDTKFDKDLGVLKNLEKSLPKHQNPVETYKQIESRIDHSGNVRKLKSRRSYSSSIWTAAAIIIMLAVSVTVLTFYMDGSISRTDASSEKVAVASYTTGDEQRRITLSDGSRIRVGSHSNIEIFDESRNGKREVKLEGQAFFEITHNPGRAFIVHAGNTKIEVLGTAFNVRKNDRNNIYVAVLDGSVAMEINGDTSKRIVLENNMLGIYDSAAGSVISREVDVNNYISWMHGRIIFNRTPFAEVVQQLEYIYDVRSEFEDDRLFEMKLTSNFSEISLENVIQVISEGLEISYEMEQGVIRWHLDDTPDLDL